MWYDFEQSRYKGTLIFNDASSRRFVFQKDIIRTLTEKYDIMLTSLLDCEGQRWLLLKICDAGTMGTLEDFETGNNKEEKFACYRILYEIVDPAFLFDYVDALKSKYHCQPYRNITIAYYLSDEHGFLSVTEESFYSIF
jgi:hypothetical protein